MITPCCGVLPKDPPTREWVELECGCCGYPRHVPWFVRVARRVVRLLSS